ncbi:MAG: M20/M25/M40 family metallo-hydrolase [Candidatus Aminicenantes bacterium]|nr:M20/M25/M40 family metallo-hydrolase [Candidatus Aminicenantes bacterium]
MRKNFAAWLFIIIFLLMFIPPVLAQPKNGLLLFQVLKGQPYLERILSGFKITVLHETNSLYLVLVDRVEASRLRNQGLKIHFLTPYRKEKHYYLVRITNIEEYRQVSAFGRIIRLEGRDCLLISDEPADEKLPLTVRWKPLFPGFRSVSLGQPLSPVLKSREVDEALEQIASDISRDNLRDLVTSLQNFATRYVYTENCQAAADYIFNYFSSLSLQPRFHEFTYGGSRLKNVIVDIPGQTYPDQVVILCAHYDSISDARWTQAPGADDNGSGTAAILEAARVLSSRPHDFTVRLIAFTAEEIGLIGSRYYASTSEVTKDKMVGVINLDMIAYADSLPEDLDIITNNYSNWLAERVVNATMVYGPAPARKIVAPAFVYSDHASFWEAGIPAICAIEDEDVNNPYYHHTTDTVDTLNFDFFLSATRGVVVCGSDVAQLLRPGRPATPRNFSLSLTTYASIFNYIKKVKLSWSPVPGAAGYNVYRSRYSHAGYEKLNARPLSQPEFVDVLLPTDWPFYYTVTAVDSLERESNMTRELVVAPGVVYFNTSFSFSNADVKKRN